MNSSKSMNKKDKGIAMQTADDYQFAPITPQILSFYKNVPLDPLLFYIRDHELYYTALHGPVTMNMPFSRAICPLQGLFILFIMTLYFAKS